MQKNPLVLFIIALCGIALIGSFILWITIVKEHALRKVDQTSQQNIPKLEVATDPSFPEIKGELIGGFPELPVYPEATLVASAQTNPAGQPPQGYRAKWVTKDPVIKVMNWYEAELPKAGWHYTSPNDQQSEGEQVAEISKGDFKGYIAAEIEEENIEIVVDVRPVK